MKFKLTEEQYIKLLKLLGVNIIINDNQTLKLKNNLSDNELMKKFKKMKNNDIIEIIK